MKRNIIIAQIRIDANFAQLNTCDTEILPFFFWGGTETKTPVCVRIGGGVNRGTDVREETRIAESWEWDVSVRRFLSFPFVFFLICVCVG